MQDEPTLRPVEVTVPEDAAAMPWHEAGELRVAPIDAELARARIGSSLFARTQSGFVLGRYTVLARLGSGAMGIVYAAYDPRLDRRIALKLVHAQGSERAVLARFEREARALAMLSDPHVVTVHDVGIVEGASLAALPDELASGSDVRHTSIMVYIAMELVDGVTLGRWLGEQPRRWPDVIDVLGQAGRGLAAVHAAGLVHRDVKPENIMIGRDRARLMDFGLARVDEPLERSDAGDDRTASDDETSLAWTGSGAQVGTPAYMAPEQHFALPTDHRSDQFSFCVTLWEALYGERPFHGTSIVELAVAKHDGNVREPSAARRRSVPAWLHAATLRGMAPDPESRWPSMEALLAELERRPRRARTMRRAVAGAVAVGVAAAVGAVLAARDGVQCTGAPEQLDGITDTATLDELAWRLAGVDVPHAPRTAALVHDSLQRWHSRWIAEHRDACSATHVRGEQSTARLDERAGCLDRARRQTAALVATLRDADVDMLEHALAAVGTLRAPELCRTSPAATTAAIDNGTRATLDEARALLATGRYEQALARVMPVLDAARAAGHSVLVAESGAIAGQSELEQQHADRARTALEDAHFAALAVHDRDLTVGTAQLLAFLDGALLGKSDDALRWIRTARAHLDAGAPADLVARIEHTHGVVLGVAHRTDEAIEHLQLAADLFGEVPGMELHAGRAIGSIGLELASARRSAEAIEVLERALAIEERWLGPDHPHLASTLSDLASAEQFEGRREDALRHFERSLAIAKAGLGPDHPQVASVMVNAGLLLTEMQRRSEALALLADALAIYERIDDPRAGDAANNIGHAHALAGEPRQAVQWFERSQAIYERHLGREAAALTYPLLGRARALLELDRPADAVPLAERGHRICLGAPLHDTLCASLGFTLARALWDADVDRTRAHGLAVAARTVFVAAEDAEETAHVDAWLDQHAAQAYGLRPSAP